MYCNPEECLPGVCTPQITRARILPHPKGPMIIDAIFSEISDFFATGKVSDDCRVLAIVAPQRAHRAYIRSAELQSEFFRLIRIRSFGGKNHAASFSKNSQRRLKKREKTEADKAVSVVM